MKNLKSFILTTAGLALISFSLASTGCKDGGDECDAVVAHTIKLMPAEFAEQAKKGKDEMVKKCKELPAEGRKCVLDAKGLEDLGACKKYEKK